MLTILTTGLVALQCVYYTLLIINEAKKLF